MPDTHDTILEAAFKHHGDEWLTYLGHEMFRFFTQLGFPPDMFVHKLQELQPPLDTLQMVYIVGVYQGDFIQHRRLAGVRDEVLERTRRHNISDIASLISQGEIGAY